MELKINISEEDYKAVRETHGLETGSTSENLQTIGLDWYKQLNRPTKCDQTWTQAGHKVFGGPFYYGHKVTDYYDFS